MLVHLDVSKGSENAGDQIITQAITTHVLERSGVGAVRVPTHQHPSFSEKRSLFRSRTVLAGGSNLLSSHMERHRQWFVTPDLALAMRGKVILCGVGWWQYQSEPCYYTERLLKWILNPSALHSVRDSYTAERLGGLGFKAVNTGCPTMWQTVRTRPNAAGTVVATLTDYLKNPENDRRFLQELSSMYGAVRVVAMAQEDVDYFATLDVPENVRMAGVGLATLDHELSTADEYVGTRLHAGVRALQIGVPAVVIAVDNRATEIARDTALPVIPRGSVNRDALEAARRRAAGFLPAIDRSAVDAWRADFGARVER